MMVKIFKRKETSLPQSIPQATAPIWNQTCDDNIGDFADWNIGDDNIDDDNIADWNIGDDNIDDENIGDWDIGHWLLQLVFKLVMTTLVMAEAMMEVALLMMSFWWWQWWVFDVDDDFLMMMTIFDDDDDYETWVQPRSVLHTWGDPPSPLQVSLPAMVIL